MPGRFTAFQAAMLEASKLMGLTINTNCEPLSNP